MKRYSPLPAAAAAPYDVDVAVVGGGPAGMSAAIRVRWTKSYRSVPCSVAVFESGRLGGLATWRSCALTGPGFKFRGDGLLHHLLGDFERFHIPVVREGAVALRPGSDHFVVSGDAGTEIRALSVIVATGFRALANEAEFIGRGVFITYLGYEHFSEIFESATAAAAGRGLVIAGNAKSRHLAELARSREERAGGITWLIDEGAGAAPELPGRQLRGRVVRLLGEREDEGESILRRLRIQNPEGERSTIDCGALLLDYNAFELAPSFGCDRLDLRRDERGFVAVDRHCATSVPGVFAAGDITGHYASTAMALGDGVNAGFGAYRYVFRRKFGREPELFAYAPSDRPIVEGERDLPPITPDMIPIALAPPAQAHERSAVPEELVASFDGARSIDEVCRRAGIDVSQGCRWVEGLIERKLGTVHRVGGD